MVRRRRLFPICVRLTLDRAAMLVVRAFLSRSAIAPLPFLAVFCVADDLVSLITNPPDLRSSPINHLTAEAIALVYWRVTARPLFLARRAAALARLPPG